MARSVLYMWMSLDGYIAGPDDEVGQALGRGGEVLHASLGGGGEENVGVRPPGPAGQVFDEFMSTGAVFAGRRTFDHAGHYDGNHHDVPVFVPTRGTPPEPDSDWIHYVTDGLADGMRRAKEAAGDKDVMVHGAELTQELLREGLLDELEICVAPVLLGGGRRLFGDLVSPLDLELTRVLEAPGGIYLRYRVT